MGSEPIDFDECLKDSPKFRQKLKDTLSYMDSLESSLSKTIKQINNYIETGREHIRSQQDFINSMQTLNSTVNQNQNDSSKRISTLLETLEEIKRLNEIVLDQSVRTIGNSLTSLINDDLFKIKEARKSFDKISHEYDQALIRYSQPIKRQQDDMENLLIATSTAFTHTSLDLSIQLTAIQSKKGYEILNSLLSFTKAHSTFFHQGSDLFEHLKPHINSMDEFLLQTQDEYETLIRNLPSKHLMVSNNELKPLYFNVNQNKDDQQQDEDFKKVHFEGYLFKRASNGFKVWNRRWFILKDHQLLYQKRGESQPTIMEKDIRLLTVRSIDKTDPDHRRFCFEVLSPHKSHILQADSEIACNSWISAIQAGIKAAFHDSEHKSAVDDDNDEDDNQENCNHDQVETKRRPHNEYILLSQSSAPTSAPTIDSAIQLRVSHQAGDQQAPVKPQRAYMIILAMPGNDACADCGAAQPKWASINLGITLCIECAGIHRSLGVHLSKVRSLTLDLEVWSPEIVQLMLSLGNNSVNSAYLACYREKTQPIDANSSREDRESWIKSKYLLKTYMPSNAIEELSAGQSPSVVPEDREVNGLASKEANEDKERETEIRPENRRTESDTNS